MFLAFYIWDISEIKGPKIFAPYSLLYSPKYCFKKFLNLLSVFHMLLCLLLHLSLTIFRSQDTAPATNPIQIPHYNWKITIHFDSLVVSVLDSSPTWHGLYIPPFQLGQRSVSSIPYKAQRTEYDNETRNETWTHIRIQMWVIDWTAVPIPCPQKNGYETSRTVHTASLPSSEIYWWL